MTTPIRVAFICVQNAGRSQMATAFAETERSERGLEATVAILTGGTHPADQVHPEVVTVMDELGYDISDRTPQHITTDTLETCDYVATMGCSTLDLDVDVRDWDIADPHNQDLDTVRAIRDDVRQRVTALFDDIEATLPTSA